MIKEATYFESTYCYANIGSPENEDRFADGLERILKKYGGKNYRFKYDVELTDEDTAYFVAKLVTVKLHSPKNENEFCNELETFLKKHSGKDYRFQYDIKG